MSDYIILTNSIIIVVSLIAFIFAFAARFTTNKYICAGFYVISFLCVVGCTIYALLLGAELIEVLAYLLIFTLLGLTSFFPASNEKSANIKIIEEKKDTDINSEVNEKEEAEGMSDEL